MMNEIKQFDVNITAPFQYGMDYGHGQRLIEYTIHKCQGLSLAMSLFFDITKPN